MIATDPGDLRSQTSPGGATYRSNPTTEPRPLESAASTYEDSSNARLLVRSGDHAGGAGIHSRSGNSPAIRLDMGGAWRTVRCLAPEVHHWASGKSVSARSERMIRRVLAAVRRLDQGSRSATRARVLAVDESLGISVLELLKRGEFVDARGPQLDTEISPCPSLPCGPGCSPSTGAGSSSGSRAGQTELQRRALFARRIPKKSG